MRRLLLLPLLLVSACDFFADEGFPCAADGTCPGGLFCVDDVCVKSDPGGRPDEGEGEEGEGEEGEGEGDAGEGEGEGEGVGGFVFGKTVLDLPAQNFFFATAGPQRTTLIGWTKDAVLGRPALTGEERLFVADALPGQAFTLRGDAAVTEFKSHFDHGYVDVDGAIVVSGFVAAGAANDTVFAGCDVATAGRLSIFSLRLPSTGGCEVVGRATASSTTGVNRALAVPWRRAGAREFFGITVGSFPGDEYDFDAPATATLSTTDWGSLWLSDDGGDVEEGVAESWFLNAADAATGVVVATSDLEGAEPTTFLGGSRAPQADANGLAGFARRPSRSLAFSSTTTVTADRVTHVDADPVVLGTDDDACAGVASGGLFVARLRDDLQGTRWQTTLCGDNLAGLDALVVDGDEVLLFFFSTSALQTPEALALTDGGGPVAVALDADSGAVVAAANAVVDDIDGFPAAAAFAGLGVVCDDRACAITAHRQR